MLNQPAELCWLTLVSDVQCKISFSFSSYWVGNCEDSKLCACVCVLYVQGEPALFPCCDKCKACWENQLPSTYFHPPSRSTGVCVRVCVRVCERVCVQAPPSVPFTNENEKWKAQQKAKWKYQSALFLSSLRFRWTDSDGLVQMDWFRWTDSDGLVQMDWFRWTGSDGLIPSMKGVPMLEQCDPQHSKHAVYHSQSSHSGTAITSGKSAKRDYAERQRLAFIWYSKLRSVLNQAWVYSHKQLTT